MLDTRRVSGGKVDTVVSLALRKYLDWLEGAHEGNAASMLKGEAYRRPLKVEILKV